MLPKGNLGHRKVELSGGDVEIRSLTNGQVRIASNLTGDERATCAIAFSTGTDKADVAAWLADDATPASDVATLLNAIMDVSGLTGAAQFQE